MENKDTNHLRYGGQVYDPYDAPGLIIDLIPQGASVLDLGCGTGSISKLISDIKSANVLGVEPSFERAEAAKKCGINVMHGEFSPSGFTSNHQFDVILFADVLEHLTHPEEALLLARRYLKPTGFIVASVPNVAHWTVRLNLIRGRFDYTDIAIMDRTHLRWFTKKTIRSLFSNAGLQIDREDGSSGTWMPEYSRSIIWKWINLEYRNKLIQPLAKKWPSLFACQYVVKASFCRL